MAILVTGGAGYIGSHMVLRLVETGRPVIVLDDLSTGHRDLVAPGARFIQGDIGDEALLRALLADHDVEAVIHFAGSIVVPDSVADPLAYYLNNTVKSRALMAACVATGVGCFVFSSTAAVYGNAARIPIGEDDPLCPINPYGRSKLMTEWMLADAARAYDLRFIALRYFNVAGADPQGRSGQASKDATHLIKVACEVATGKRAGLQIYGTDYDTPDGTCVRDYIHVTDLVEAHMRALDHLGAGGRGGVFNCGYGRGHSVKDVVASVNRVLGRAIPVKSAGRRAGDPPALVAEAGRIRTELGWRPRHDDLDFIVKTALAWENKLAR